MMAPAATAAGDISLFQYNGNATLSNLTLVGSAGLHSGAKIGIQLRGAGSDLTNGTDLKPMGTVSFNNVDVSGNYQTSFIGVQDYSDVSHLSFSGVKLGGQTSEVTGTFGDLLRFDAVGTGSVASPATVNLGDTDFRGLSPSSPIPTFLEFAPDNNFAFLRADATNTSWNLGSGDVAASALTLTQAFAVEDHILDYEKPDDAGQPFKGWAEIQAGKAFVTPISSNISRAIQMVDTAGTVYVNDGTYNQDVTIGKSVTLLSANGSAATTINGQATGFTGAVTVSSGVNNVQVGDASQGFTINGAGQAGVYLVGNNSDISVLDNTIQSAGASDNALLTGGGEHTDTISGNAFTGTSAQLVYINGTADVNVASDHVNFNHNTFSGSGNLLLGDDADNSSITSNTFSGNATVRLGTAAAGLSITGNTFSSSPTAATAEQFDATISPGGYNIPSIVANNTFDRAVIVKHGSGYLQAIWANIQGGVNASVNNDTVIASAGDYVPEVTVNDSITLQGAQAGNAADGLAQNAVRAGGETQVENGIRVNGSDVTVDGFLFDATDGTDDENAALLLPGSGSGFNVENNIFRGNVFGLYLNSDGTDATTVSHNLFDSNNNTPNAPVSGTAIYSDQNAENITINSNKFVGDDGAITLGETAATVNNNITISNNTITNDGSIYVLKTSDLTIKGNTIEGGGGTGIRLAGGDSNVTIESNDIADEDKSENGQVGSGIAVVDDGFGLGPNSNITIKNNHLDKNKIGVEVDSGALSGTMNVNDNHIAGNTTAGVENNSSVTVDATANWWGDADGPNAAGNVFAPTSGDSITGSGTTAFIPWLTDGTDTDGGAVGFVPEPNQPPVTAPTQPTIALTAASDTGASHTDDITSDSTPTFTGTTDAGATVQLFEVGNPNPLGSAIATGGSYTVTDGTTETDGAQYVLRPRFQRRWKLYRFRSAHRRYRHACSGPDDHRIDGRLRQGRRFGQSHRRG